MSAYRTGNSISSKFVPLNFRTLNQLLRADEHYMSTKDLKIQLANLRLEDGDALDGAVATCSVPSCRRSVISVTLSWIVTLVG